MNQLGSSPESPSLYLWSQSSRLPKVLSLPHSREEDPSQTYQECIPQSLLIPSIQFRMKRSPITTILWSCIFSRIFLRLKCLSIPPSTSARISSWLNPVIFSEGPSWPLKIISGSVSLWKTLKEILKGPRPPSGTLHFTASSGTAVWSVWWVNSTVD